MTNARPLILLIDGQCPLCVREAAFLRRLDKGRGRLAFEDIADERWDPSRHGLTLDEAMGAIHAVTPEGAIISGVEVFRRAYRAIGWGWLLAPTAWPVLRPIADRAYRWFARNRIALGERFSSCPDGRCRVPPA